MASFFNRVAVAIATAGTGTVTFGSELNDAFLTPTEAGAVDTDTPYYLLEEGDDFEIGIGTVGGTQTTLSRDTVLASKIGGVAGTTKMTLAGNASLRFVAPAGTLLSNQDIGSSVQAYDAQLDTWSGVTPSANGQSLVSSANYASMRGLLDVESGVDFDPAGTDNSTDVSLSGTGTYISLVGQVITVDPITVSDISDIAATYQPLDAQLTSLAALTASEVTQLENIGTSVISAAEWGYVATSTSAYAPSANGKSLVQSANYASMRTLLDLEAGTDFYSISAANAAFQALDADTLKADTNDTLTAGFHTTVDNDGTKSSGTYTPTADGGNHKRVVNGGAHTLAPPAADTSLVIHYTNNGSAGAITTSGFTLVDGDAFTTTNAHEFICYVTKIYDVSHLTVKALQ